MTYQLRLKQPQQFQPNVFYRNGAMILTHDPWDLSVTAISYDELEHYVMSHVQLLWHLLVHARTNLNERGTAIRDALLQDFEEIHQC